MIVRMCNMYAASFYKYRIPNFVWLLSRLCRRISVRDTYASILCVLDM